MNNSIAIIILSISLTAAWIQILELGKIIKGRDDQIKYLRRCKVMKNYKWAACPECGAWIEHPDNQEEVTCIECETEFYPEVGSDEM